MLLKLLLSNNTGFIVGVVIEAVLTVAAVVLLILVLKFGLPNFEPRERKPKQPKAPKQPKPGPEKYVLKYVAGEGSGESPALEQYAKGAKVILKVNMFTTPTGKVFSGWSDGEKTYGAAQKFVMPAQAVTLTAQWAVPEAEYALRYVAGEGSGEEPTEEHYKKGAQVILKTNMFTTPAGKVFDGWSDGENKYSSKFALTMPAQAVTLTAQWKEIKKDEPEQEPVKVKAQPAKEAVATKQEEEQAPTEINIAESDGEVQQVEAGTTPDGRPIIVNVYNTQGKSEKTVEKEIIRETEEVDNEGLEFADYTILQLYDLLTDEQKRYFDALKDAALSKPQAKLTVGRSFFNIKIGKRSILKLRIRRLITVGEYSLENDILKDFRKSSDNKEGNAKIKVRPTLVAVTDEATLKTALNMIDLVHKQILEG